MITLLASIFGFLGPLLPHILRYMQDKQDKAHDLAQMDRQLEFQKLGLNQRLEEIQIQAQAAEVASIHMSEKPTGTWIDAFNASVRPIIAYGMFVQYVWIRWTIYNYMMKQYVAVNGSIDLQFLLETLHDNHDMAILASVISFYFGNRYFEKKLG